MSEHRTHASKKTEARPSETAPGKWQAFKDGEPVNGGYSYRTKEEAEAAAGVNAPTVETKE